MSEDLLRQLRFLEGEYAVQPLIARQADLHEINRLRAQLGLPRVDADLRELEARGGTVTVEETEEPARTEAVPDHTEARKIYQAYLQKVQELAIHQAYANEVTRATSGRGQTPVWPLATLGPDGGPLLCDHCHKPIVLEGGPCHGMTADVAWEQHPVVGWTSWILGGMVVEIQTNGTLRIYHGYPGRDNKHCCNIASREDRKARDKFDSSQRSAHLALLIAFIENEFPELPREEQFHLLNKILDTMFSYDPGIGINRPRPGRCG